MGVGLFSAAQTPPNSFSYPDGLGELLYGGDGDGVLPWLSKPAEVTRELLRKTERTQLAEPGNQPCFPPTKHSSRAVSAQHLITGSSGHCDPAATTTENGQNQAGDRHP